MKRIKSKNPNRTEENCDLFDYVEGQFIVKSNNNFLLAFKYTGNNMQESIENRFYAKNQALKLKNALIDINPEIEVVEEDI